MVMGSFDQSPGVAWQEAVASKKLGKRPDNSTGMVPAGTACSALHYALCSLTVMSFARDRALDLEEENDGVRRLSTRYTLQLQPNCLVMGGEGEGEGAGAGAGEGEGEQHPPHSNPNLNPNQGSPPRVAAPNGEGIGRGCSTLPKIPWAIWFVWHTMELPREGLGKQDLVQLAGHRAMPATAHT